MPFFLKTCLKLRKKKNKRKKINGIIEPFNDITTQVPPSETPIGCDSTNSYVSENSEEQNTVDGSELHESAPNSANENEVTPEVPICSRNSSQNSNEGIEMSNAEGPEFSVEENISHSSISQVTLNDNQNPDQSLLQNSVNSSISNISGTESNGTTDIIKNVTVTSDVFNVIEEINALKSLTNCHSQTVQENISAEKENCLKLEPELNSDKNFGNTAHKSGDFDYTSNNKKDNNIYSNANPAYPEETSVKDTCDFVRGLLLLEPHPAYQDERTSLDANCNAEKTCYSESTNLADKSTDIDAEQILQSSSPCLIGEEKEDTQEANVLEITNLKITQNSSLVNNTETFDLNNEIPDSHIQQSFQSLSVSYDGKQENAYVEDTNIAETVCESVSIEYTHQATPINSTNCIAPDVICPDETSVLISKFQESNPDVFISVIEQKHQITELAHSEETHESKLDVEADIPKEGKEKALVESSEDIITLPQDKTFKTMCDASSETDRNCIFICTEKLHLSGVAELPDELQFNLNAGFDLTENEINNESTYKICEQDNKFIAESLNQMNVLNEKNARDNNKNKSDIYCIPLCESHVEFRAECLHEDAVAPQDSSIISATDTCREYGKHVNDKSIHISSKVNDKNSSKKTEYVNEKNCLNLIENKINEGIPYDFLLQQEREDNTNERFNFLGQSTSDSPVDNLEHCNNINVRSAISDDNEQVSLDFEDLPEKTCLNSKEIECKNCNSDLIYFTKDFNINQQMECIKADNTYTSYEIESANEENPLNALETKMIEDIPIDIFLQIDMKNGDEDNKRTQVQQPSIHSNNEGCTPDNFQILNTEFCTLHEKEDFSSFPENLPAQTKLISKEVKCKTEVSNLIHFSGNSNPNLETESIKEINAYTPTNLTPGDCWSMHDNDYQEHICEDTHVKYVSDIKIGENIFHVSNIDNDDEQKGNYNKLHIDSFYEPSAADICANNKTEDNSQNLQTTLSQEKFEKRRSLSKYSISSISGSSESSKLSINDDVNETEETPTRNASFIMLPSGDAEERSDNVDSQDVNLHKIFPDERYYKPKSNNPERNRNVKIRQTLKRPKVITVNTNTKPRNNQNISKRKTYSPLLFDYYPTDMEIVSKKKYFTQGKQYLQFRSQRKPYLESDLEDLNGFDTYETETDHLLNVGPDNQLEAKHSKMPNLNIIETGRKDSLEAFKWQKLQAFSDMKSNMREIPIKKEESFEFKISSIENNDRLKKGDGRQLQTFVREEDKTIDRNVEKSYPLHPHIKKEYKEITTRIKSEEKRNRKSALEQKLMHRTLSPDTENENCSVTSINISPARKRILNVSRAIRSPKYLYENNRNISPNIQKYKKGPVIFEHGNLVAYVTKNYKTNEYEIKKGFKLNDADLNSSKYKFYETENINFDLLEASKNYYTNRAVSPEALKIKFDEAFKRYAGKGRSNGKLISHKRSTEWLRDAGVVGSELTAQEASDAFKCTAGVKVALNKGDYRHFLKQLSRLKRLNYYDIYDRLCAASNNRSTENSGLDKEYGYC